MDYKDRQADGHTDRQSDRKESDRKTERQTDKQSERQTDRRTDRRTGLGLGGSRDRSIDSLTHSFTLIVFPSRRDSIKQTDRSSQISVQT